LWVKHPAIDGDVFGIDGWVTSLFVRAVTLPYWQLTENRTTWNG